MITSIDKEKAFGKIQNPSIIKIFIVVGTKEAYLKIIKAIYDKSTANIMPSGEKLKTFLLNSAKR